MEKKDKILMINPEKCTGCRLCEVQAVEYKEVDDVAVLKKQDAAKELYATSHKLALKEA